MANIKIMKKTNDLDNLRLYIKTLRLQNLNCDQLINKFENIKENRQYDAIIHFINELSKKDPLTSEITDFFKYLYNKKETMGRKNLENNFKNYMPFNNICWNRIYDNNTVHHCNAIKIFHDFGFSIDTMNNQGEDAIISLCATFNHKNLNVYNNVNNRMVLFNALMNPTEKRIRGILNEILAKSVSDNAEYIKKIRWCLLINPFVTIEHMINYFFAINNRNKKIEIYDEIINYITKSIVGIDKIKSAKKLGNDIKLYISEKKSKYDIYIGQNNDNFLSEKELKAIIFDLLVIKGYDYYKMHCCNKFKDSENNKMSKLSHNIDNNKNLYDIVNKSNDIKLTNDEMEYIVNNMNIINNMGYDIHRLDDELYEEQDCRDIYNTQKYEELEKYKEEVNNLESIVEDYIFSIIKNTYPSLSIDSSICIKYSSLGRLHKAKNLVQFNSKLNKIFRDHILNELIFLEKSKQQIINNYDQHLQEFILELDNKSKVNVYLLMCFLIIKNFFTVNEVNSIQSEFVKLCKGTIGDINIIYTCVNYIPNVKKYFPNVFLEIAKNIKLENNTQKKFKMMDILENVFKIKVSSDTNFEELENNIKNIISNMEPKMEKVNYENLLTQNYNNNNLPIKNVVPPLDQPTNSIKSPIKSPFKNDPKKHMCKFIGMGEKCIYGKKCKFSHRIN